MCVKPFKQCGCIDLSFLFELRILTSSDGHVCARERIDGTRPRENNTYPSYPLRRLPRAAFLSCEKKRVIVTEEINERVRDNSRPVVNNIVECLLDVREERGDNRKYTFGSRGYP